MGKVFEDYFSELQADMVSLCLEYVNKKADDIYIYCYHELGEYGMNVFYKINGKFVKKHKVNEVYSEINASEERQTALLRIGNEDVLKVINLCKEYSREVPTEMKLIYNVDTNKLEASYSYDLKFTNLSKSSNEMFNEWFEEVSK
jgi:hypothetical protein